MWKIFLVALLGFLSMGSVVAWGQNPQKPTTWVNNNECNTAYSYELSLPSTWVVGPPGSCTFHVPYWSGSPTTSGLQSAINDIEACRTATGVGIALDIPPALYTSSGGIAIPQTNTTAATKCLVLRSTQDSNLANGRTVCSHGVQDNLASSTDIGIDNPDCAGDVMSYQNGINNAAITGGSCPGTTCTITTALNPGIGSVATVYGVTPAGYNGSFPVTSSSSTQFQFLLPTGTNPVTAFSESGTTVTATSHLAPDLNSLVTVVPTGTTPAGYACTACTVTATTSSTFQYTVTPTSLAAGTTGTAVVVGEPAASAFGTASVGNITNLASGPFTLANGTVTNTSNYDDVQYMWTVEGSGTIPYALQFCSPTATGGSTNPPWCGGGTQTTLGPDHWLIEDTEIRPQAGNKGDVSVVNMHSASETTYAQLPNHIHFRKIWLHGDWPETTAGIQSGANSISGGFVISCYYCSIVDSQTSQILRPGAEGHAIFEGWTTVAKINHNWISGDSIGSLCGGLSNPPTILGLVPCTNMEWRRNRFTFPYAWLGAQITSNPNWPGTISIVRKNAFEQKEGFQDILDGNIIENVDESGGQGGPYGDWKSINTSGGVGTNYQSITANITITDNIFRNACNGIQVMARSDGAAASLSYPSFGMYNLSIQNNLFYNATLSNPGCSGGSTGHDFQSNNAQWKGTITGNGSVATFTGTCAPQVSGNCPSGPPPAGFLQMGITVGDPLLISGCTVDTAFNTATTVIYGHTVPILGALAASASSGLVVTFPSTATVSDNSGNCLLDYIQGWPKNLQYIHNTFINNLTWAITDENEFAQGPNYARNNTLLNNIVIGGGWFNNPLGEGTNTEIFGWDVNTLTAGYNVWPTRTASNYTEFEPTGGCAVPTGCSPPVTMYFPSTPYCTGSTPTSSCVGFIGAMSASSMPLTLADYHNWALVASSSFKSGGAYQASDGTDMGSNISAIDAAQTLNQYPGGFPDNLTTGTAFMGGILQ